MNFNLVHDLDKPSRLANNLTIQSTPSLRGKTFLSRRHLPLMAPKCVSLRTDSQLASDFASTIRGAVLAAASAMGAAVRSVNLQITRLLDNDAPPPSPVYLLLLAVCLLPLLDLCAPVVWKRFRRAVLASIMATMVHISSSQVAAAAQQDMLIFPTKTGGIEQRSFAGKKHEQLKDMCRDFGLAVSGNKTQLKARLQELSEKFCNDPASCDLQPVKRRSHKGPRDGSKKSQPKQSANRRAAIIDTERVTERSKDTRTADEMENILRWADRTVARLPYKHQKPDVLLPQSEPLPKTSSQESLSDRSLHARMENIESHLAVIAAASGVMGTYQASTQAAALPIPSDFVVYDHTTEFTPDYYPDDLFHIPSDIHWSTTSPDHQNLCIGPVLDNSQDTVQIPVDISTSCIAAATLTTPISTRTSRSRSIRLANETILTITDDEIKQVSVPATSFAEDIQRLNQMWDDTSTYWKGDSVIVIGNRPIALVYWRDIFKKTGLWSAHKSNWTEWKGSPYFRPFRSRIRTFWSHSDPFRLLPISHGL
ncbi:hypothetical protein C8R43DRAFT_1208619 [Mycena crocata]|nr:hypothetical protein C8R43DRAFT_1208619 [Mycena crocata]